VRPPRPSSSTTSTSNAKPEAVGHRSQRCRGGSSGTRQHGPARTHGDPESPRPAQGTSRPRRARQPAPQPPGGMALNWNRNQISRCSKTGADLHHLESIKQRTPAASNCSAPQSSRYKPHHAQKRPLRRMRPNLGCDRLGSPDAPAADPRPRGPGPRPRAGVPTNRDRSGRPPHRQVARGAVAHSRAQSSRPPGLLRIEPVSGPR